LSGILKALSHQNESKNQRFYMPGHKGILPPPLAQAAPFDQTELDTTGSLWEGKGPILKTQERFAKQYSVGACLLSTQGSTLCIQAMLALFCACESNVLMSRCCHVSAVNAAALLGLNPVWLWPDEPSGIALESRITPAALEQKLSQTPNVSAVYITSPDYFGALSDIEGLARVCRGYCVPLLVDNAHGAHLSFFDDLHPMHQGADACCDSLHKTLPALTGTALLHLRDENHKSKALRMMKLFASTSPSYLLMLSADMLCDAWQNTRDGFRLLAEKIAPLRQAARAKGVWAVFGACDPVRISLAFGGENIKELMDRLYIEPEILTKNHAVLLPSPISDLRQVKKLIEILSPPSEGSFKNPPARPTAVMPLREAVFSECEFVDPIDAVGRVAAQPLVCLPPGLPIVMPGEFISRAAAEISSGIGGCYVIK
jgi:arginine decarboxylase